MRYDKPSLKNRVHAGAVLIGASAAFLGLIFVIVEMVPH